VTIAAASSSKKTPRKTRGPLSTEEIVETAIMADLATFLSVVGFLLPFGGALFILSPAPYAVLASRHRAKTVWIAALLATILVFFFTGPMNALSQFVLASIGYPIGTGFRQQRHPRVILVMAFFAGWASSLFLTLSTLFFLKDLRMLIQEEIEALGRTIVTIGRNVDGITLFGWQPGAVPQQMGHTSYESATQDMTGWFSDYWIVFLPVGLAFFFLPTVWAANIFITPALQRIRDSFLPSIGSLLSEAQEKPTAQPNENRGEGDKGNKLANPLPLVLEKASLHYPATNGFPRAGIRQADINLETGLFVGITGLNGGGKTSLIRLLAGHPPTEGIVSRPGPVGMGELGGTALIAQRPETQVLGARIKDDLCWGLPPAEVRILDIPHLLELVGLDKEEDQETAGLSGGELQRLAVASALAHRPRLLLSDESTSMLDPIGRQKAARLLASLPRKLGITVVHVTHILWEIEKADLVIAVENGRIRWSGPPGLVFPYLRPMTKKTEKKGKEET